MTYYSIKTESGLVQLPSVTTILDATMDAGRKARLASAVHAANPAKVVIRQQQARDTGNDIDRWIKDCLQSRRLMAAPQDKTTFVRKALPWLRPIVYGAVPCWTDTLVYSLHHRYAGTLDAIAPHPLVRGIAPHPKANGLVLYEFKTSRYKVWPIAESEALLQASAYALAWGGANERRLEGICTVHITPYALRENLITDAQEIANLQQQFLDRRRRFASALSGEDLQYV